MVPELWFQWLNVAIIFLIGLALTIFAYRRGGFLGEDDIIGILGLPLLATAITVGILLVVGSYQLAKENEENKAPTEQKETLESAETREKLNSIASTSRRYRVDA